MDACLHDHDAKCALRGVYMLGQWWEPVGSGVVPYACEHRWCCCQWWHMLHMLQRQLYAQLQCCMGCPAQVQAEHTILWASAVAIMDMPMHGILAVPDHAWCMSRAVAQLEAASDVLQCTSAAWQYRDMHNGALSLVDGNKCTVYACSVPVGVSKYVQCVVLRHCVSYLWH